MKPPTRTINETDTNSRPRFADERQAQESGKINMVCSRATRARIEAAARNSGRTLSKEAEHVIERCFVYDDLFARMGATVAEIERGTIASALARQGFFPVRTIEGTIFAPRDYRSPDYDGRRHARQAIDTLDALGRMGQAGAEGRLHGDVREHISVLTERDWGAPETDLERIEALERQLANLKAGIAKGRGNG